MSIVCTIVVVFVFLCCFIQATNKPSLSLSISLCDGKKFSVSSCLVGYFFFGCCSFWLTLIIIIHSFSHIFLYHYLSIYYKSTNRKVEKPFINNNYFCYYIMTNMLSFDIYPFNYWSIKWWLPSDIIIIIINITSLIRI